MAKRKGARPRKAGRARRKAAGASRSGTRPSRTGRSAGKPAARQAGRKATSRRRPARAAARSGGAKNAAARKPTAAKAPARPARTPRLERARRTLVEPTPPSSLDLNRRGSAVRTGRAGLAEKLQEHRGMPPLTGGDVDADVENAYFSGDEAPGGDNPTPDQDIVEEIGRSVGIEYQDNEELRSTDKVVERDKHRWELDPASSEDYKDRK